MKQRAIRLEKVESLLSQRIKNIYQNQLEHKLNNISYKLFDRTLIIVLEGTITSPEKLVRDNDRFYLAKRIRESIDSVINPQIKNSIEDIFNVKVVDFLSDTTIEREMTGAIAIFEFKSKDI